jgi:putative tryptophan/tyrosine transport system substrate-binding protein
LIAKPGALVAALVLLLTLTLAPLAAEAQNPSKIPRIGLFHVGLDHDPPGLAPMRESLKRMGYEEGRNIRLDYRNQADEEAARSTAQAFVRERVDILVAFENQAVRAARAATSEIPVIFAHVSDPVAAGFVKSIARPGGNLTGVADFVGELQDKRVQILGEMVRLRRLLILTDPTDPATQRLRADIERVAPQLKVQLVERHATTEADVTKMFASLKKGAVDGMVVISPKLITNFPALILRLSLERQIPLAWHRKALAEQGALFSYGPNFTAVGQDIAGYVDRILKGAKPADLPVQQVARLELVINARTARTLGLTIPPSVLSRADQIID